MKMTLDIATCPLCDKAVVYEIGKKPICPECLVEVNDIYNKVRTLLRDYPEKRFGTNDVAKILKVDEKKIKYLLENGMFQLVYDRTIQE